MKPLALVIENDGSTRRLLDVLLSRTGLEVDLVPTGSDALILLQHVRYDAVLIDLLLPGTSGMQVLEWIERARPSILPKCVVLSSAPERQLQKVRELWPEVRIIRKPFELGEIIETAQSVTTSREPRVETAIEEFVRRSVRAGAKAGLVVTRTEQRLELLHAFGYQPGEAESYFPLALDAPMPLCAAVRNARPVWLASLTMAAAEYPLLVPVFERNESRAIAAVPLVHDGQVAGVAGWSFREVRLFSEAEQQLFIAIAEMIAEGFPDLPRQSMSAARA